MLLWVVHKRRPQSGGEDCPLWIFFGKGGGSSDADSKFFAEKN